MPRNTTRKPAAAVISPDQRRELIRTGFLVHDVSRLRHRVLDKHVKSRVGITRHQWWLLVQLRRSDAPMTQQQISRLVDIDKVPLGRTLDRLQQKGLIERRPDPVDRRSKRVHLSAAGLRMTEDMLSVALMLGSEASAGLSLAEQKTLNALLTRMKRNLVLMENGDPEAQ